MAACALGWVCSSWSQFLCVVPGFVIHCVDLLLNRHHLLKSHPPALPRHCGVLHAVGEKPHVGPRGLLCGDTFVCLAISISKQLGVTRWFEGLVRPPAQAAFLV